MPFQKLASFYRVFFRNPRSKKENTMNLPEEDDMEKPTPPSQPEEDDVLRNMQKKTLTKKEEKEYSKKMGTLEKDLAHLKKITGITNDDHAITFRSDGLQIKKKYGNIIKILTVVAADDDLISQSGAVNPDYERFEIHLEKNAQNTHERLERIISSYPNNNAMLMEIILKLQKITDDPSAIIFEPEAGVLNVKKKYGNIIQMFDDEIKIEDAGAKFGDKLTMITAELEDSDQDYKRYEINLGKHAQGPYERLKKTIDNPESALKVKSAVNENKTQEEDSTTEKEEPPHRPFSGVD